jgi:hypothetical protein
MVTKQPPKMIVGVDGSAASIDALLQGQNIGTAGCCFARSARLASHTPAWLLGRGYSQTARG